MEDDGHLLHTIIMDKRSMFSGRLLSQSCSPVIAYDRLLMDTDAVSYYATFDNKAVGTLMAQYVEENMNLATAEAEGRTYTVELFMGSPDDNNAYFVYDGIMEVIQPYLDNGVLVCKSGQIDFESNNTVRC